MKKRCCAAFVLPLALVLGWTLRSVTAQDESDLHVRWGEDYCTLSFTFLGQQIEYPQHMLKTKFPPAGKEPEFHFEKNWPIVAMVARWTASVKGWPEKYRSDAVDLILMYVCDAQMYENIYPDVIRSSKFTFPPEFLKEAANPGYKLAETMRGKEIGYEVKARGGFGASDYKIRTRIRTGLSKDEKTVFYYDKPEYISDHLKTRQYIFAAYDAGDYIHFEARLLCACAPRRTFRGEAMRRVEADSMYFVRRIYEVLDDAPTLEEIETYLKMVREGRQSVRSLLKKR
ncbi:MAG: hypothetical protein GXP25_21985 [Planctomycetes bacterium]|nr:hypothetical protein [Planctomycetota bacterium]